MIIRKELSYILVNTPFSSKKLFFLVGGMWDLSKEQGTWAFMRNMSGHIPELTVSHQTLP
jgi:hypothetical protein